MSEHLLKSYFVLDSALDFFTLLSSSINSLKTLLSIRHWFYKGERQSDWCSQNGRARISNPGAPNLSQIFPLYLCYLSFIIWRVQFLFAQTNFIKKHMSQQALHQSQQQGLPELSFSQSFLDIKHLGNNSKGIFFNNQRSLNLLNFYFHLKLYLDLSVKKERGLFLFFSFFFLLHKKC